MKRLRAWYGSASAQDISGLSKRDPQARVRVFLNEGQPDYDIIRPAAYDCPEVGDSDIRYLAETDPRWIYFGTLEPMSPSFMSVLQRLLAALPGAKRFYDFVECPGNAITLADAVGAGDAFSAALIYGLMMEWDLDRVAAFANQLGSLVASRHGGIPPWTLEEVTALET